MFGCILLFCAESADLSNTLFRKLSVDPIFDIEKHGYELSNIQWKYSFIYIVCYKTCSLCEGIQGL